MDFFRFFVNKPKPPVPTRCTVCGFEMDLSQEEADQLQTQIPPHPFCPIIEECHICHTGFMIPVNYTDKNGNHFIFEELKHKIKPLDSKNLLHRIVQKTRPYPF